MYVFCEITFGSLHRYYVKVLLWFLVGSPHSSYVILSSLSILKSYVGEMLCISSSFRFLFLSGKSFRVSKFLDILEDSVKS